MYVLGNQVTVYTDYQALVKSYLPYLKSQTKGLLAWWYLRLARFLPTVRLEYKPDRADVVANALSRAPVGDPEVHTVTVQPEQDPLCNKLIYLAYSLYLLGLDMTSLMVTTCIYSVY